MELTELELEFLRRLADEPWTSPPLFDHLVVRLVEAGLVQTETLPTTGAVQYAITEAGKAAIS
jgi:DNA-binding PadR family transcriptional regulator